MKTHVFKGPNSSYGFDADSTGANLPADKGPWKTFKELDLDPNDPPRIGGSSKEILDGIAANGYYITTAEIQITVGEGNPS